MNDLTPGEIHRRLDEQDRRMSSKVSREVYERDLRETHNDVSEIKSAIKEIKESGTWAIRLVIAQFLTLVVGLLIFLLGQP